MQRENTVLRTQPRIDTAHSQIQISASNFYVCVSVEESRARGQKTSKEPMRGSKGALKVGCGRLTKHTRH